LIVLAAYIIFQIRLRQLMRLQEIRHRIATDLHDDIGSALSSISISSQLAKKFSGHDADKFDRTLNSINVTSRETLESMSDIVWAINPKNDTGKNMIMKMQRVTGDLLESKGINVRFEYDDDFEKMKLGMEGRKAPACAFAATASDITAAAEKQLSLLHEFSARVRAGGRLVYATCSLSRFENEEVVAAFLEKHPDFSPTPFAQTCNIAYPRALLEAVGGFDEALPLAAGEDTDLAIRAQAHGAQLVAAPEVLTYHAVEAVTLPARLRETWRWQHLAYIVGRHPQLREHMPLRLFWKPSHALLLPALAGLWLARRHPIVAALLIAPWALVARPAYGSSPRGLARAASELPARMAVDITETAAMARGSLRHRTPML